MTDNMVMARVVGELRRTENEKITIYSAPATFASIEDAQDHWTPRNVHQAFSPMYLAKKGLDDDDLDRMSFRLEVCSWHTYGSPFAARPILALAATR